MRSCRRNRSFDAVILELDNGVTGRGDVTDVACVREAPLPIVRRFGKRLCLVTMFLTRELYDT